MSDGARGSQPAAASPTWAWIAGYGCSTLLAFPQPIPGLPGVVDLGIVAAPLAVGCLLMALEGLAPGRAGVRAFFASLASHAIFFHWFYVVTVRYGHAPPWLGALAPLVPALYVSLFTAAFAACWRLLHARGLATPLAAALLWTAIDHLRGFALGGFPWATLGYAEHLNTPLLGLVRYTGVYGLSFVVVLAGAGLAHWLRRAGVGGRPPRASVIALAVVAALHALGAVASRGADVADGATVLRVAALQGNIDQDEKWSEARAADNLASYLSLSRRAVAAGAQVIVWPESAVPGLLEFEPEMREAIAALARQHGVSFVLGATGARLDPRTGRVLEIYDSAFSMGPSGDLHDRYDKSHLVPFGEFVPLRGLLGDFFEALARGLAPLDVSQGQGPRALSLALGGPEREIRVGAPICYELLFPGLVRRIRGDGARVLFAITNDAWYGRTGAPYQFLAMTALRSAENSVWTLRAANSGISAIIDARGGVVSRSEIFVRDLVVGDIPLSPKAGKGSFYSRRGDVFAVGCWIGALGLLLRAWLSQPRTDLRALDG